MNLTEEMLAQTACLPASELWAADRSSVAYLATDGKLYSVRAGQPILGQPEDTDLRSVLFVEPLLLASKVREARRSRIRFAQH
jgi:hypothetical protein